MGTDLTATSSASREMLLAARSLVVSLSATVDARLENVTTATLCLHPDTIRLWMHCARAVQTMLNDGYGSWLAAAVASAMQQTLLQTAESPSHVVETLSLCGWAAMLDVLKRLLLAHPTDESEETGCSTATS